MCIFTFKTKLFTLTFILLLHVYYTYIHIYIHIYTYTTMCKCFGVCKCKWIYYLPFMTIVFKISMLIGCGCIPKLKLFLQWATLIGPSQKIMILWYYPNIKTFSTNMGLWWCYFEEIFWMQNLLRLITWIQLL